MAKWHIGEPGQTAFAF